MRDRAQVSRFATSRLIKSEKVTALVGSSGAGKSSIADLLVGL